MRTAPKLALRLILTCLVLPAAMSASAVTMSELQSQAQQLKAREAKIWAAREVEQRAEVQKQEKLAADAQARHARANAKTKALDSEWSANEGRLADMKGLLTQHQGSLGELFGVTRQVAGDSVTVLGQSLIDTQFPVVEGEESRVEFMRRIAGAKDLPAFAELERMWYELHREMTENGKVVKFNAPVVQADKSVVNQDVVRVGPFVAMSGGNFLEYSSTDHTLSLMERQIGSGDVSIAEDLEAAAGSDSYTEAVVDPSRGALLSLVASRPNVIERISHGEVIGYVIVAVGLIGILASVFQYVYLLITSQTVRAQLNNLSKPSTGNPLGRLLLEYSSKSKPNESPEVVELRLSEAVLREVPKLQRFQAFLRIVVAAGPLLGLVGTVIGMIVTFHTIISSGSSDPKLMAHGIGQAMIATVLGLGIAIPVLFLVTGLGGLSNGIIRVLDEQCQSLLAKNIQKKS